MKHSRKYFPDKKSEAGATLVVIIIAMVVVAILGAGMLALFSTSLFNQTEAQKTAKAYYLSESGIRIAAGEYKSAAVANRNATLLSLQGKTFNLPDNGGSVTLQIYPYWFYVLTAQTQYATSIVLYMPGVLPPVNSDDISNTSTNLPAPGILKSQGSTKVGVFTSATVGSLGANGTPVTFTVSNYYPCSTIPCIGNNGFPYAIDPIDNLPLYLGYVYNSPQHILMGGNLVFDDPNNTAWMYPPVNGNIIIRQRAGAGDEYTYQNRIINSTSTPHKFTLTNIRQATTEALPNIFIRYDNTNGNESIYGNVNKTTQIYLGKTLGVRSQSEYVN